MVFVSLEFLIYLRYMVVNKAEKLDGPIGIILDDVIAGIYTLIILLIFQIVIKI